MVKSLEVQRNRIVADEERKSPEVIEQREFEEFIMNGGTPEHNRVIEEEFAE